MLGKRILLVDDEEIILDTYSSLLSEKGYSVDIVNSGRKALEKFSQHPFDLVITDLAMMDEDGLTLLEKIKTISPNTPVIILTGISSKVMSEFSFKLGVYALIEKPYGNEIFLSCVRDSLT